MNKHHTYQKYPDGSGYATVHNNQHPTGETVFRINNYEDLWKLNQYVDAYNSYSSFSGKHPHIVIPNLIDAQADRRFNNNHSSGLKLVCEFLNNMDATFSIFHPHNVEVVEALIEGVTIHNNTEFVSDVLNLLREMDMKSLILMSSDAGGYKPLMKLCDEIGWEGETHSASKSRKYENGKSKLTQIIGKEDFAGKDVMIIDDLCIFGGTFKGLATKLRTKNVGKLYLVVSHMTMQNLGDDPVTNYFDKVFTTNSKFDNYLTFKDGDAFAKQPSNLYVINHF